MHNILSYWIGMTGSVGRVDRVGLWTAITAIGTIALACIAWWQLQKMNDTSKADFIYKFTQDFFTEHTRRLIMLFDCDLLKFNKVSKGETEYPFFTLFSDELIKERTELTDAELKDLRDRKELKQKYSGYEIDDNLLGFFEDIADFVKRGTLDFEQAYGSFDWYVETIWENAEIKKYITSERKRYGNDVWAGFEEIYNRLKLYREKNNL